MTEPSASGDRPLEQDVIDKLLDLFVYAPLGAAVEFKDFIPDMAAKGREVAGEKLPMYRTIGEFAVTEATKRAEQHTGGITDILSALGLFPSEKSADTTEPDSTQPDGADSDTADSDTAGPDAADSDTADSDTADAAPDPAPTSEAGPGLAIEHYDELPAVEIVKLLSSLNADERAAIEAHERANRGRRTILGKLDQLAARS